MQCTRRRTCKPTLQLEFGLASIPTIPASVPADLPAWTALPEPTERRLTELLTRLLVSHAAEVVAAPAGSDAHER
jgi:hypothetical protein